MVASSNMAPVVAASGPSIAEMWKEAEERFFQLTEKRLDYQPASSLEDIVAEIDKRQQPEAMTSGVEGTATSRSREYGRDIARCIKLLGGVAVQGYEMGRPPSGICFNAIALLLDIPQHIRDFRVAVDGLFEAVAASLSMFKIYERVEQFGHIEPELNLAIHRIMISFVDICALSIRLRDSGKWRKIKTELKAVLLQKDSGVLDELRRLDELSKAHHSIQATQTLKTVLENNASLRDLLMLAAERGQNIDAIAQSVKGLRESDAKRKTEEERRNYISIIRDKLGIEDKTTRASMETCAKLRSVTVRGSGTWIRDCPEYAEWADRNNADACPVLLIKGDANTGKTVLLATIFHDLKTRYEASAGQSAAQRTLVTSYFFPSAAVKGDDDKRPVETALKCLAVQLAELDIPLAKAMSQECVKKADNANFFRDASCRDLWDTLGLGRPRGQMTYYIIIDGLATLPEKVDESKKQFVTILEELKSKGSSVRLLLSVLPDALGSDILFNYPTIEMAELNGPDIQRYVDDELNSHELIEDIDEELRKTWDTVRERLISEAKGSYYKVQATLKKIRALVASGGTEAELFKVLDESSGDDLGVSEAVIKNLHDTLRAEEIDEINELLVWVIHGFEWFSVDEMKAAMFLRQAKQTMEPLKKKLTGKYGSIFMITEKGIEVKDGMERLLNKDRTEARTTDSTPRFTATITITKGDLSSVQSFLWSLMQKTAQDNFGFQQLDSQATLKSPIKVNVYDAHFSIVQTTFKFLADPPNKKTQTFGEYLMAWLPDHLKKLEEAKGLDELTPAQKQFIGDGVFALVDDDTIIRHWESSRRVTFFRSAGEVQVFRRWLSDPVAICSLRRREREWLEEVRRDRNPNQALLKGVTKLVAHGWMRAREWDVARPLEWIRGYLAMPASAPDEPPSDDGESVEEPEIDVQTVVDWCQQTLGIKELDSLWYERLAQTYRTEGLFTKAIETYEKALALPDADTNCLEGLAIALAEDDRLLEACTKMTEAVQFLEQDQEANKERLTDDYKCLGRWKDQLQQAASAIEYTQKALDLTPSDAEARFSLLQLYLEHNEGAALVTFMNKLAEAPYDGKTPTPFAEIMKAIALNSNHDWLFSRFFSVISTDAKLSAVLMVELDRCIVRAEKGPTTDLSLAATLQLYKGIALYNYAMKGLAETDSAIPCWDRCLKIGLDTQWNWAGRIQASRLMASHFFEQARRSTDPADRQKHFERLRALAEDGNPFEVSPARTYLAVYYLLHHDDGEDNVQKQEQRKKLSRGVLRQAISSAFELLSDDDEDNDVQGFLRLAEILRFSGDEVNARAAYSVAIPGFPEEAMSWLLDFPNEPERSLGITLAREANEHGFWQISQKIDWVLQELDRREGRKPPQTENGQNEQLEASGKGEEDDDKGDNGPGHVNEGRDSTNGVNHDGEEVDGKRKEKEADGDHSESDNVAAEAAEEAKEADMPEKERLLEEEQEPDEAQSGAEEKQTSETTNEGHEPTAADPTPLPGAEAIRHALTVRYRRAARYDLYWKSCDGVCEPTTVWDFSNDIWTCVFCYNIDFCSSCRDKLASGNLRTLKTNGQRCNSTHRWMRLPKWDRATFMRSLEGLVTVGVEVADDGTAVGGEAVPFRTWIDGLKKEWEWAEEKAEAEAEAEAGAGGEAHHGENETAATMASKAEDVAEGQEGEERHGKANGEALANGSVSGNAA